MKSAAFCSGVRRLLVLFSLIWISVAGTLLADFSEFSEPLSQIPGHESGLLRLSPGVAVGEETLILTNPSGAIAISVWNESESVWQRQKVLRPDGTLPTVSVALSGDLLVVGRKGSGRKLSNGNPAGAVFIYERNEGGANQWGEVQILEDWHSHSGDFGTVVATDGETIAVRDRMETILFRKQMDSQGRERWFQEARILAGTSPTANSIAISGEHLVIIATDRCRLYRRTVSEGTASWLPNGSFSAPQSSAVALHGDTLALTGANSFFPIKIARFNRQSWTEVDSLSPGDLAGGTDGALGFSGNTLALGAYQENNRKGRVYLFQRSAEDAPFSHVETLESTRTDPEQLGAGIAVSEGVLAILGPEASDGTNWNGIAYIRKIPPSHPVITNHPESTILNAGDPLLLHVRATGPSSLVYRWYRDAEFLEETSEPVLQITETTTADAGIYFVEVVAPTGTARSGNAVVTVQQVPLAVLFTPDPVYLAEGSPLDLMSEIAGSPPFTYQWFKDGSPLSSETEKTLSVPAATAAESGIYQLRVRSGSGEIWSDEIPVFVTASSPAIIRQPNIQFILDGDPALLFVEVHGSEPLTYEWTRNGQPLPGASSSSLFLANPRYGADAGTYRVTVSNAFGSTTSEEMRLIIRQRVPLPVDPGQRAQISVPNLSYDLYLPSAYDPNGPALPILITFAPGGGGMVNHFRAVAGSLQMIVVGATAPRNGTGWRDYSGYLYLLENELRERVNFDPNRLFAAGFSGGGWASFDFAKAKHPHVAGVFSMEGWMGEQHSPQDRYQENLIVSRSYAALETHFSRYNDAHFLMPRRPLIRDWVHAGGHISAPSEVQFGALGWMLQERAKSPMDTREEAQLQAAEWRANASAGRADEVVTECLAVLATLPRTWMANNARMILEDIFSTNLPDRRAHQQPRSGGDLLADYLFFYAYGAEQAGHHLRAWNALQIWKGLTENSQDRMEDVEAILARISQPPPAVRSYVEWSEERLAGFPAALRDPESDANGDGISNFLAYALGLDPAQNNAAKAVPILKFTENENSRGARVGFRRSGTALESRHQLEISPDLRHWFPVDLQLRAINSTDDRFEATLPLPLDGNLFVRQRLELTD